MRKNIFYAFKFVFEVTKIFSGSLANSTQLLIVNGICSPSSCSSEKVVEFANTFLKDADLTALTASCRTSDVDPIEVVDIVAM